MVRPRWSAHPRLLGRQASSLRLKETAALEDAAAAKTQKMLLPAAAHGRLRAPRLLPALAAFTGAHI